MTVSGSFSPSGGQKGESGLGPVDWERLYNVWLRRAGRAEAERDALRAAVEAVCAEVEADDERHLDMYGQHLPGSVVRVAEMVRAALVDGSEANR